MEETKVSQMSIAASKKKNIGTAIFPSGLQLASQNGVAEGVTQQLRTQAFSRQIANVQVMYLPLFHYVPFLPFLWRTSQ